MSPQDIFGILSRTCTHVDESLNYPNIYYGYGQIDVYKGLLDILNLTSIKGVSTNQPKNVKIQPFGDGFVQIAFNEIPQSSYQVHVYAISGTKLRTESFPVGKISAMIDIHDLPKGVYVIQVDGSNRETTGSTLIRR